MNDNVAAIRNKLHDFIKVADERKIKAIYTLLEHDIESAGDEWVAGRQRGKRVGETLYCYGIGGG